MRILFDLGQDARYGARMLLRSPGFTLVCVLSLGIGIGLNTSVFSQFESMIFRAIPQVADPDTLVTFQRPLSYPDYERIRDHGGQFSILAAYLAPVPFVVNTGAGGQRVWGHLVTPNYFETLGVRPLAGRLFGPPERDPGSTSLVVSHRFWQRHLSGDRRVVGRRLMINGQGVTIVGVAPENFLGASPMMAAADLWAPTTAQARVAPELGRHALEDRRVAAFQAVGRLEAGIALPRAEAALDAQIRRIERDDNDPAKDRGGLRATLAPGGRLIPVRDQDLALVTGFPIVLVSLTLWIACSNVATMLLARSATRRKEICVRLAMGARRGRVIRQLLTESVLLALLGGVAGYLFAIWSNSTMDLFEPIMPNYIHFDLRLDWKAWLFTAGISVLTGVLFGLAPAIQATRSNLATGLKAGAWANLRRYRWYSMRNTLVLQQVAGSLVLLLLTGIIVIGFYRTSTIEVGFDPRHLFLMSLDPVREGYGAAQAADFFAGLPERVRREPGVLSASLSQNPPWGGGGQEMMDMQAEVYRGGKILRTTRVERVGAGYFETAGIALFRGRSFRESDQKDGARVAIINQSMARDVFGDQEPVGRHIDIESRRHEIVGVAGNVQPPFFEKLAPRMAYLPLEPAGFARPSREGVTLMVRGAPGVDVGERVRRVVSAMDANLTVFQIRSMTDQINSIRLLFELTMIIYGGIGVFSLVLAAGGLAGVTAYAVARRAKEIGIRVALGAARGDILRLVLREGVALVVLGTVLGLAGALGVMRALAGYLDMLSQITETTASDPVLLVGAPLLLAGLALLACWVPAYRSTRMNPLVALREE